MVNFENIANELENETALEPETVKVEVVSIGGVNTAEVSEGTTVGELRTKFGLSSDVKILDEDGEVMNNADIVDEDITLYTSVPKKNGNK